MESLLFWTYMINAVLIIDHEIESAYWEEWKIFKLPGGVTGFLILHFPVLFLILYGVIEVKQMSIIGLIFSIILSIGGIFAFSIHTYFLKKGRNEFRLPISRTLLYAIVIVSVIQLTISLYLFFQK